MVELGSMDEERERRGDNAGVDILQLKPWNNLGHGYFILKSVVLPFHPTDVALLEAHVQALESVIEELQQQLGDVEQFVSCCVITMVMFYLFSSPFHSNGCKRS